MARTKAWRVLPAVIGGTGLALVVAGPAMGQTDPPGNNGTVKIDRVVFDDHPDNEPHVGCEFQVDLYGFDEGDLQATVLFEAIPPTLPDDELASAAGTELLTDELDIGEDAAGGGTDLDASGTYDLTEALAPIEPHAQQGWHVRLTVHAEGSQGADTKHKVFWVAGCGETPPTTAPHGSSTSTTGGSTTTTVPGATTSTTEHGGSSSSSSTSAPTMSVAPSTGGSTTTTQPGGGLPNTGSNVLPMAVVGTALVGLGAGGVVLARRMRLLGR
jgi:LPXTG-motif cell wall-anchored protein